MQLTAVADVSVLEDCNGSLRNINVVTCMLLQPQVRHPTKAIMTAAGPHGVAGKM
jgi:hypothetical protein